MTSPLCMIAVLLLLAAAGCSIPRDRNELRVGAPVPAVVLRTPDGKPFTLLDRLRAKGLPVIVFYRGHW